MLSPEWDLRFLPQEAETYCIIPPHIHKIRHQQLRTQNKLSLLVMFVGKGKNTEVVLSAGSLGLSFSGSRENCCVEILMWQIMLMN